MSKATSEEKRVSVMAAMGACQNLGYMVGPGMLLGGYKVWGQINTGGGRGGGKGFF